MQHVVHLPQFCVCYECTHFLAAMRVLKYLHKVRHKKLTFRGGRRAMLVAGTENARLGMYSDSDWVIGSVDTKSYSGNAIYFSDDTVVWFTHK